MAPSTGLSRSRRFKSLTLLAALVLSGLTLLVWTGQWYSLTLRESPTANPVLSITGDVAAPALIALALASIALVAALAIAGPFFRAVLGVLQVLIGFTVGLSAMLAQANPVKASEAAISAATGVGGAKSVAALVTSVSPTAYPVIAIVVGILTMALGVFVLVTGRRWPGSSGRYRQPVRLESTEASDAAVEGDSAATAVSDWDSLSGGGDPTSR
jgi:hypothetical protein